MYPQARQIKKKKKKKKKKEERDSLKVLERISQDQLRISFGLVLTAHA